jgi:hypothetical protein
MRLMSQQSDKAAEAGKDLMRPKPMTLMRLMRLMSQ